MAHIITNYLPKSNNFNQHPNNVANTPSVGLPTSCPPPHDVLSSISDESISQASALKLGKTKHEFVMLVGRLIEQYGKAHARLSSLSYMLSEKTSKTLKKRAMIKLSRWFEDEKMGTRRRSHKRDPYLYQMSEMAWAYYHIHRHRIKKSAPQISKKCTSITKSITKIKDPILNKEPIIEIYRANELPYKEKREVVDIKLCLDEVLQDAPKEVATKVREQIMKMPNKNKIKYPYSYLQTALARERIAYYAKWGNDEKQQAEFRASAHRSIELTYQKMPGAPQRENQFLNKDVYSKLQEIKKQYGQ